MNDNYLITGYWGEPHVTAENDRGINAATFGVGRFVLPVGERLRAEYIGNNTIRMYDGKLMDNGAAAGIPTNEHIDLLIANTSQGKKRNDLIVFQYSKDSSTLIETGTFVVIQGEETDGTASDPALTQGNLLHAETAFEQMALWRVSVSGGTISAPEQLFTVSESLFSMVNKIYPIGSIYMSVNNVNPSVLFGGTWTQIKDRFLLSAGDKYAAGSTGGSADAALLQHTHRIYSKEGNEIYLKSGATASGIVTTTAGTVYGSGGADADYRIAAGNVVVDESTTTIANGSAGRNMPPYLTVYMWRRTA